MQNTPRGMRLHIGIFGKRNVGKSNILNVLTKQNISIVSDVAGTTTDPVEKAMELLPLGPVVFVDTAGVDDEGKLGEMRVQKTFKFFDRTDLAIIVSDQSRWGKFEKDLYEDYRVIPKDFMEIYKIVDNEDEIINIIKNAPLRTDY